MSDILYQLTEIARVQMLNDGYTLPEGLIDCSGKYTKFAGRPPDKRKTEAYKATLHLDGVPRLQITYFSEHDSLLKKARCLRLNSKVSEESHEEMKERVARMQEQRKQQEAVERKLKEQRSKFARERFEKASIFGTSDYLIRKKIGSYGIKFESFYYQGVAEDIILIPMRDKEGKIQALQEIYASKRIFRDGERPRDKNYTNACGGLFHILGDIQADSFVYICEGYATGSSIYQATNTPTVLAFSSGQISSVCGTIRELYPTAKITIAADFDHHLKENVGYNAAQEAAKAFGCKVIIPKFKDNDHGTDFNDVHCKYGIEELKSQMNNNEQEKPKKDNSIFKRMNWMNILSITPKPWDIGNIICKGEIGMIYGPPGIGKTFVIIDLIISCCLAKKWANTFDIPKPLSVLYFTEEGLSGLPKRFKAASYYHGFDRLDNFELCTTAPQLFSKGLTHVSNFIKEHRQLEEERGQLIPIDLIIIDTLHNSSLGADENSSRDMGEILASCKMLTKEFGCSVILIHHTNKSGTAERGSTALRGDMELVLKISKKDGRSFLYHEKVKDGEYFEPKEFNLLPIPSMDSVCVDWIQPASIQNQGENKNETLILSILKSNPNKKYTIADFVGLLNLHKDTVRKILNNFHESGLCRKSLYDEEKPYSPNNPNVFFWNDGI